MILLLSVLFGLLAHADLVYWKPAGQDATYVLPEGQTPESYLKTLNSNKDLKVYVHGMQHSEKDFFQTIKPNDSTSHQRVLLIANNAEDHQKEHPRLSNFNRNFPETYVIPIGAALSLNPEDRSQFYKELTQHFGLLVAMGGDDIDPYLYKEKVTYSVGFNRTRDLLEAEIIRYFYYESKRKIFAVCRGLQLTSVVLGAKLVQDNTRELHNQENHLNGAFHPLVLSPTTNNHYASFMQRTGTLIVNSYHHQSILDTSLHGTPLEVSAKSPEGIVEAVESKDGRVILVQSHPELADNGQAFIKNFFSGLRDWAKVPNRISCKSVISY